jgi:hypothetical protein
LHPLHQLRQHLGDPQEKAARVAMRCRRDQPAGQQHVKGGRALHR